ncbi:O-acetyltransferase [Spirochaetia bacterium]|nr:O-acetyltransferase [Spirochaetia bacterium]
MVALGHLHTNNNITIFIYSFHMPLFFFISGCLEKNRTFKEILKNGINGLIIPYLILYSLSFLGWVPSRLLWHKELFENTSWVNVLILKPLVGMLFGVGYNTKYSTMMNIPLWFLVGMFFVKIIHKFLILISKNNIKIYAMFNILIILLVVVLKQLKIDLLFSIDSAFLAFPFFAIGYLIHTTNLKTICNVLLCKKLVYKAVVIIIAFFMIILMCKLNGYIDINAFNYGNNILLFYVTGVIGIIMVVVISSFYIKELSFFRIISNGTIFILAFHGYASAPIVRVLGMYAEQLPVYIAIPISIVSTIIMVLPIIIIKKYFPIILGGRK